MFEDDEKSKHFRGMNETMKDQFFKVLQGITEARSWFTTGCGRDLKFGNHTVDFAMWTHNDHYFNEADDGDYSFHTITVINYDGSECNVKLLVKELLKSKYHRVEYWEMSEQIYYDILTDMILCISGKGDGEVHSRIKSKCKTYYTKTRKGYEWV